ncbi:AMIN-like domain-containing (lipo)protein [Streptomyces rimosus]|uniref:AMIN-like domain-containing (lipo)protein n=1 Tax=Streptomyces rimosus TaxID=1927 RepID=UPI0037B9B516
MRRLGTALTAVVLAGAAVSATAVSATAASATGAAPAAACDTAGWGSALKSADAGAHKPLTNIRTGQHDCFDRMVFEVPTAGGKPVGYRVGYVKELHQDGSGDLIKVGGGAILEIRVAAPSYDPGTGRTTYPGKAGKPLPGVNIAGYRSFKDTRFAASFEGDTQIGLGVAKRLPFRVTQQNNQLIVDVAHS